MKIYTKTGDKGETDLFGGERVSKDHPRLEAYGSIDELNSHVGWLRALKLDDEIEILLERIQNVLFNIGSELSSPDANRLKNRSSLTTDEDVALLEKTIDTWEEDLPPLGNFILPGGTESAARAHMIRTVARRAERQIIRLKKEIEVSLEVIKYLNRLSDFAFVLARLLNKRAGKVDMKWNKGRE